MKQTHSINYYFKISWKEILFFIFLWLLVYIEPITIGPLKISQIWKTIVVIGLLFYIIPKKKPSFFIIGILFSLKYLVYTYMPYGYLRAIQDTLEGLIFPIFLAYFFIKYRNENNSSEQLLHIAILLSLFIIYSAVPFLFGLESLNPVTDLENYGIEANAMKGLFYHIASSSKLFTISTIVLINTYKRFTNSYFNRLLWISAVLLGSYFVYTSWTRTGWFIFIIALLASLFYEVSFKQKVVAVFATIILSIGIFTFYQSNEAFRWRLNGGATYRDDTELTADQLASSRLPFIFVALDNLKDEGLAGQLLGYGTVHGQDLFEIKTNMAIGSHNRTFEILESSGILALLLYIIFIYNVFKKVIRNSKYSTLEIRKLAYLSMIMFLGFYFSSHGTPLWGEIIYACFFMAIIIDGMRAKAKYLTTDNE